MSGGLAGVLAPGEKGSIGVIFEPVVVGGHVFTNFAVDVVSGASTPINWDLQKDDLRPLGVSAEAWTAVFQNFKTGVGATVGSYQAALVEDANYLGQFGKVSPDAARLLSFEIEQADDFGAISDRYTPGDLGRGHTAPFSLHTEADEFGNVSVIEGQSSRGFVKLADGTYHGTGSEIGKLTRSAAGVFTLDEGDGTKTVFRASDGHIDFLEDTNGHRFTAAWSAAGKLQSITDNQTNDATLFTCNAQGRIATATDPVGRVTTYGYDASGEHLTSVATPAGTTSYTYDALENRIGKIENGVRTDFAYDPAGLGNVFGEYQGASTVAHYASGLGIAARADAGNVASFYHFDANGNTALLSGAGGAKVAGYTYLPFGKVATQTGASAQPFTFDGREGAQDDAADLYNLRARTYDAKLVRFTSRDPLGFGGGDTNTYRYVRNNPVNLTDPSGLLGLGGIPTVILDAFGNVAASAAPRARSRASSWKAARTTRATSPPENSNRP